MQRKKWFATVGVLRGKALGYGRWSVALTIVIAALTLVRGAAGSQLGTEPDIATAGETPAGRGRLLALRLARGAASSQPSSKPDAAGAYNILHLFTWAKYPTGNLIFDAPGNLYGTTSNGGSRKCPGGCGVVWKLGRNPKGTRTVSILHAFTGADGANPFAGLALDNAGNLYGTTARGGTYSGGAVFKLAPNADGTWTESVLYTFTGGGDGGYPLAGLALDAAGNLYGTTYTSGAYHSGVVFKLAPNPDGTWAESVLHSFTGGADGSDPVAGLIFDAAGNLYGTAQNGGGSGCSGAGCGVVFKLAPNPDGTWTESVLYTFTGGADGALTDAGLVFDNAGNLYGTTDAGGSGCSGLGCGVVFKLAPNPDGTWTESVLHSFTGADGASGVGLILNATGNLYGTTVWGGAYNYGVVFKLTPSSGGWSETVLHSLLGYGRNPQAPVIFDSAGNLYGTTSSGNGNSGLVFEITR